MAGDLHVVTVGAVVGRLGVRAALGLDGHDAARAAQHDRLRALHARAGLRGRDLVALLRVAVGQAMLTVTSPSAGCTSVLPLPWSGVVPWPP